MAATLALALPSLALPCPVFPRLTMASIAGIYLTLEVVLLPIPYRLFPVPRRASPSLSSPCLSSPYLTGPVLAPPVRAETLEVALFRIPYRLFPVPCQTPPLLTVPILARPCLTLEGTLVRMFNRLLSALAVPCPTPPRHRRTRPGLALVTPEG